MLKRLTNRWLIMFSIAVVSSIAAVKAETSDVSSINAKDKYSHWSVMASGGFNMLITERMGDWDEYKLMGRNFNGPFDNFKDNFAPSGILQVDYMFTPQFGLRLQYLYAPINKKAIYLDRYIDIENNLYFSNTNGQSHQVTMQLEVNMLNLFYRCRGNTQWGWYIGAGIGTMLYKLQRPDYEKYRPTVCVPINTSVEFSPISSLSIVLHAEFDWYGDDELNGWEDPGGQVNDMGLYVGLGLRYNIAATKRSHVRISDMCTFEPLHVGRATDSGKNKFKVSQTANEDIEELQDKMDELEKRNRELQDKIELMNREIMERLDQYLTDTPGDNRDERTKENSSTDNSRNKAKNEKNSKNKSKSKSSQPSNGSNSTATKVPESSYKEQSSPVAVAEAPVESERFTPKPSESEIKQQQIYNEAMLSNGTEANEVVFDLKSSRVNSKFEIKIGAVAKRMLANKKLRMDIIAYIKKENLTKENVKLATQRLEAIYFILVNRYQIDPNRVNYDIQEPVEGDDGAVMRCDMIYR